jgi:hypothetical protein
MTKAQKQFIELLMESSCNISDACKETGTELKLFHGWMKLNDFREGYDTAIQIRDDEALVAFMDLVKGGDRGAVVEYQKMQRQREDLNEIKSTKREVMRVLIEHMETKSNCLKEYCQIFKGTKSGAEDQFANVVAEFGLKTPHQRMKERSTAKENQLSTLFDAGKLSEVDMYSRMLSRSLDDTDNAEYPGERSKARADVISINQRLDEIHERNRRNSEKDTTKLPKLLKAFVMQTNNKGIDTLDKGMQELKELNEVKAIEVDE